MLSWENLGAAWAHRKLRNSAEVEFVDLTTMWLGVRVHRQFAYIWARVLLYCWTSGLRFGRMFDFYVAFCGLAWVCGDKATTRASFSRPPRKSSIMMSCRTEASM